MNIYIYIFEQGPKTCYIFYVIVCDPNLLFLSRPTRLLPNVFEARPKLLTQLLLGFRV